MPQTISARARKILAKHPPGTVFLPSIGAVNPTQIESFTSNAGYCWVKFRDKPKPVLLSWPLPQFAAQLPTWTIVKVRRPSGKGGPNKRLIPVHP